MPKIESIAATHLDNASHLDLGTTLVGELRKHNPEDTLRIEPQVKVLADSVEQEAEAFKTVRRRPVTARRVEVDNGRDTGIRNFGSAARSMARSSDPKRAEHAVAIAADFNAYNFPTPMADLPMDTETTAVRTFIAEMRAKHAEGLSYTGLNVWLDEVEAHNEAFAALGLEKQEAELGKPEVSLRDARRNSDRAWSNIKTLLKAGMIANGEEPYREVVAAVNVVLKRFADLLAMRKGRGAAASTPAPEAPAQLS